MTGVLCPGLGVMNLGVLLGQNLKLNSAESFLTVGMEA